MWKFSLGGGGSPCLPLPSTIVSSKMHLCGSVLLFPDLCNVVLTAESSSFMLLKPSVRSLCSSPPKEKGPLAPETSVCWVLELFVYFCLYCALGILAAGALEKHLGMHGEVT